MTTIHALLNPGTDRLDYIGVKSCGCMVAWCASDIPARELANILAKWVRGGLSIERCTTDESRKRICRCNHKRNASSSQEALGL